MSGEAVEGNARIVGVCVFSYLFLSPFGSSKGITAKFVVCNMLACFIDEGEFFLILFTQQALQVDI